MSQELVYDFELRAAEFTAIRELVLERTGIALSDSKRELVKRRFTPRLRALAIDNFGSYIDYVRSNYDTEGSNFCNAITTNLTSFFRESHHYDFLEQVILPAWLARTGGRGRLRLWSAGCSTGQEAYCMAISLLKVIPDAHQRDIRILATDLDENCLAKARAGVYEVREFEKVPQPVIDAYFRPSQLMVKSMRRDAWMAEDRLKTLITFNKLNLVHPWPMRGKFDAIFCRNVFIYFDKKTQERILGQFAACQNAGSHLCLGHSETVPSAETIGYSLIGKTTYQRLGGTR